MTENSVSENTKKSVVWYTVLPFVMHLLRFANSILLARLLAPEDFGVISVVTILLYYSNSLTDFGMSNAVVQRKTVDRTHYGALFSFNFLVSIVLFLAFQLSAEAIAEFYDTDELAAALKTFAFVFLISAFLSGPKADLRRQIKFKTLSIIEAIKVVSSICVSLTLALNGFGLWSIIFAMLVAQSISTILTIYFSDIRFAFRCTKTSFKELFNFSLWSFLNIQVTLISDNIDKLILGKVLDIRALGIFDKGVGLAKMPDEQLSGRLATVAFSTISRKQVNIEELEYYFCRLLTITMMLAFPVFIGLHIVATDFTLVLLGPKWAEMIPVLELIAFAFLLNSLLRHVTVFNLAVGKIKHQVGLRFLATIIMVTVLLFVAKFGLVAVSHTLIGFYFGLLIFSFLLANQLLKIEWSKVLSLLLAPVLSSLLMSASVFTVQHFLADFHDGYRLLLSIFVGGGSYALCVLTLPFSHWTFVRNNVNGRIRKLTKLA